jgi:hypothetical protein
VTTLIEDRRGKFEKERQDFRSGLTALRDLQPLAQLYKDGPFSDGSLFAKTLQGINKDVKTGR